MTHSERRLPYQALIALSTLIFGAALTTGAVAAELKIATLSPEGSFWMTKMREGAREIETKTQQRVKFKFYPAGVMGNDDAVLRKMRLGQLHGAAFTNGSLNDFYPDNQVYNLVLKFRSYEETDYVRARMDPVIIEGFEKAGFATLGLSEIGFAYIMSTQPVRNAEDMKKLKAWVPDNNNVALQTVSAFNITPIPLPLRDVLVGLKTGLIDTVAASPTGAVALQWHTQVKYVTDLPLLFIYGVLVLDGRAFGKLDVPDQGIVREVMQRITREVDQRARQDNVAALDAMRKRGIEFITPSPEAIIGLGEVIARANRNLVASGRMSARIVETLDVHLARYRQSGAAAE
jgi:TRAP-type C4-dicarboxylate transport system substrate-binding protein